MVDRRKRELPPRKVERHPYLLRPPKLRGDWPRMKRQPLVRS
jgi:hypothetical protein